MRELMLLLSKMDKKDAYFIRQLYAAAYRYLEKKGRI